jgi:hypothetical protein
MTSFDAAELHDLACATSCTRACDSPPRKIRGLLMCAVKRPFASRAGVNAVTDAAPKQSSSSCLITHTVMQQNESPTVAVSVGQPRSCAAAERLQEQQQQLPNQPAQEQQQQQQQQQNSSSAPTMSDSKRAKHSCDAGRSPLHGCESLILNCVGRGEFLFVAGVCRAWYKLYLSLCDQVSVQRRIASWTQLSLHTLRIAQL